jgi:hypothetical protein
MKQKLKKKKKKDTQRTYHAKTVARSRSRCSQENSITRSLYIVNLHVAV